MPHSHDYTAPPDHRAVLAALPAERIAELTRRRNGPGLRQLTAHLGLLCATATGIMAQVPAWPLLLPIHGIVLIFLFTPMHEATHQTPFANRALNEVLGHFCGLLLLLPFQWFRFFHLAHHRHTQDPEHDPELAGGGPPATWPVFALYVTGLPVWRAHLGALFRNAAGRTEPAFVPLRARPRIATESRLMLLAYAVALSSLWWTPTLLWLWLVPALLGQPFLRLYLLAEHSHCPKVADMLSNTRTTFTNRAVRFLAWNMPYHAEHHSLPSVPFYQLPELHKDIAHALRSTAPGYASHTRTFTRTLDRQT